MMMSLMNAHSLDTKRFAFCNDETHGLPIAERINKVETKTIIQINFVLKIADSMLS